MPETPASAVRIPEYPMQREPQCPFAPAPAIREMTCEQPPAKVRIYDGRTPWLVTRHADQRALLNDSRLSVDVKKAGFPHMTRSLAAAAPCPRCSFA